MAPQLYPSPDPILVVPAPPPWDDAKWTSSRNRHEYPYDRQPVTATTEVTTTITAVVTPWNNDPVPASMAAVTTSVKQWQPKWSAYPPPPPRHNVSAAVMGAAGAIGTLAILCLFAGCCLFFCRRSRKRRNARKQELEQQQEMATRPDGQSAMSINDTRAYAPSSTISPPPTLTSPSTISAPSTNNDAAPILLTTDMGQSYYTGIDTSDVISLTDSQRQPTHHPGYASSLTEPPPPYRPQSASAFSRENSCRHSIAPPSYRPRLSIAQPSDVIRSPFDDPEGDEGDSPVSEVDETERRDQVVVRDMEEMSDVSEISYQQDEPPVEPRPTV